MLDQPVTTWEIAVHLAVACDVFNDISVCCLFFTRCHVLDKIWDLIGSVSDGFPTYVCNT